MRERRLNRQVSATKASTLLKRAEISTCTNAYVGWVMYTPSEGFTKRRRVITSPSTTSRQVQIPASSSLGEAPGRNRPSAPVSDGYFPATFAPAGQISHPKEYRWAGRKGEYGSCTGIKRQSSLFPSSRHLGHITHNPP